MHAPCHCRRKNLDTNRQSFSTDRAPRNRRHSYACPSGPPREFFCPISKTLMTEPVTLLNTNVTLSRTALQAWLRTGVSSCLSSTHACPQAAAASMYEALHAGPASSDHACGRTSIDGSAHACAGSRVCPVTGQELSGWVAMESNEKLRSRVRTWATEQGLNFDLLDSAQALLAQWRGNAIAEADELVLSF